MRDDRHRWAAHDGRWPRFDAQGISLATTEPERQTLISGPSILSHYPGAIEWPDIATDDSYSLCLRRDRILRVNGLEMPDGWNQEREQAVSDASDAYTVFDLSGPKALDLLKHGAELSLQKPSRSVARNLFGFGVFLYRYGAEDGYRLHVPRAQAHPAWQTLTRQAVRL
ncbi:hypothetical protein [Thalassovita aquimarina]|uniref:hypothetical protein n=1 Tax=Thalassovita aquimarina TaxID=2785917 RepID=UPI003567C368